MLSIFFEIKISDREAMKTLTQVAVGRLIFATLMVGLTVGCSRDDENSLSDDQEENAEVETYVSSLTAFSDRLVVRSVSFDKFLEGGKVGGIGGVEQDADGSLYKYQMDLSDDVRAYYDSRADQRGDKASLLYWDDIAGIHDGEVRHGEIYHLIGDVDRITRVHNRGMVAYFYEDGHGGFEGTVWLPEHKYGIEFVLVKRKFLGSCGP